MKKMFVILFSFVTVVASAQKSPVYSTKSGAINGYDPVAYFLQGKPVKGSDQFTYQWQGVQWKFSSQADLDAFKANPEKYAPQYGGYCAYGCSEGHKAPTQADAWTIVNDRLYLNYNKDVKKEWVKDTTARIARADSVWMSLKDKE